MKDVQWSKVPKDVGVFGGQTAFGDNRRFWNFHSLSRGRIDFETVIRALNDIGYNVPLSVELEDSGMDMEYGAKESCKFIKDLDFKPSDMAFDDAFNQS